MARRSFVILAQAAVVAVLSVVVYATLLAPESDEPLFHMALPPNPAELIPQPPDDGGPEPGGGGDGELDEEGPEAANPPPVATPAAPSAPAPAPTPAPPASPEAESQTPTGDQYAGSLGRMLGRL